MADDEAIEEGRYAKMPWVLNETEAAVIREGVAKVLAGWSFSAVAIDWQERGLVQPSGKPWNQDRVRVLLGHPRNAGHLTMSASTGDLPNGRRHHIIGRGNWPVIIDDAEFRRVDAILASNRENWSFRRSTYPYLLSGLVYCGRCADDGREVKLNGTQRRVPLYSCMRQPANQKHGCGRLTISARPLEAAAVRGVLEILANPDNRRRLVAYQALNSQAPKAEARIAELERERTNLRNIIQASGMDADLAVRLGTVDSALQEAKAALAQSDHLVIVADLPTTDDLYAVWDDLTVDVQRSVLREVLKRIVVRPSTRPGRAFDLDRVDPPELQPWIADALGLRTGATRTARRSRRSG
ncbi:MAG: recombinase family protein [Acidimicrobiales bacterium]